MHKVSIYAHVKQPGKYNRINIHVKLPLTGALSDIETSVDASQQDDLFGSQDAKCTKPLACKPATTKMMARAQACSDLQLHCNEDGSDNSNRSLLIFSFVNFCQTKSSTVAIAP